MKRALLLAILFATVATAYPLAAAGPATQLKTKFDPAEHDPYLRNGTAVITGQGFLRQRGGGVVTCAGSKVALLPATSFFVEYIGLKRSGHQPTLNYKLDPAYKTLIKQTQCDAQGNFSFQNIPAGNWYIVTDVKWQVGNSQQGGGLLRELTIADGESVKVLLSDDDLVRR